MKHYSNLANYNSHTNHDLQIASELEYAQVERLEGPDSILKRIADRQVETTVIGDLLGWTFIRGWRYWVVTGPGLDFPIAMELWKQHGGYVRTNGDAGGPSPWELNHGFATTAYHVDTDDGLKALADCIKATHEAAKVVASQYDK